MSICDDIRATVLTQKEDRFDRDVCRKYEEADRAFELLVKKGAVSKRGYQLLPIENQICNDLNLNYSLKKHC